VQDALQGRAFLLDGGSMDARIDGVLGKEIE